MDIREEFERWYCDMHSVNPEAVMGWRMSNGSYSLPGIATAFRCFRAGFESGAADKPQRDTHKTGE